MTSTPYIYDPPPPTAQAKTPDDILDYTLSWKREFATGGGSPGDSIAALLAISVTPTGLTLASASVVLGNSAVLFWASSGVAGQEYNVSVEVITQGNRRYTRELVIPVAYVV